MMKILQAKDYDEMSRFAAAVIAGEVAKNPFLTLMLPTGSTPEGTYEYLAKLCKEGYVSFKSVSTFNIDEYVALGETNPNSYHYYMEHKLYSKIDINRNNAFIPNGNAPDLEAECKAYEEKIKEHGGIDLLLLAIGNNGHIGFNEPGDAFTKETGIVLLTDDTIKANARFFQAQEDVPKQALCVGVSTMMSAKKIVFLCHSKRKKESFEKMINGPVTPHLPGSVLQLHKDVTIFHTDFSEE